MTVFSCLLILSGCREYTTRVINQVNRDGSVDRTVFITRQQGGEFEGSFDVPVDDSWAIIDSMSIVPGQDTTWYLIAKKHFQDVNEINTDYETDTAVNSILERAASFSRKFKWFTTTYRFEERVKGLMDVEVPVEDYLDEDELRFYYLPESVSDQLESGPDSIYYRTLNDSIEEKTDRWLTTSIVRQWVLDLKTLAGDKTQEPLEADRWQRVEEELIRQAEIPGFMDDLMPDSIMGELLGVQFVLDHKPEMDSAEAMLERIFEIHLEAEIYDMEIRMPGDITASNGYLLTGGQEGKTGGILWTVNSLYYLVDDFSMWVESEVRNTWAWYVSAAFLVFVAIGFIRPWRKKG